MNLLTVILRTSFLWACSQFQIDAFFRGEALNCSAEGFGFCLYIGVRNVIRGDCLLRLLDRLVYQRHRHQRGCNAVKTARPPFIVAGQQILQSPASFALLSQPFGQSDLLDALDVRQADPVTYEAVPVEELIVFFARKVAARRAGLQAVFLYAAVVELTGNLQGKYLTSGTFARRR